MNGSTCAIENVSRYHKMPLPVAIESSLLRSLGFRHGFATRALDFRASLDADTRADNVHTLGILLRFEPSRLFQVSQVHGAVALLANDSPSTMSAREADAIVTMTRGDAVGVRVADCVPILLADPASGAVAAVHAGWRGFAAGVTSSANALANENGATFRAAAIGPCIGACCFEVGHDVARQITDRAGVDVVARRTSEKSYVDLRRAVRAELTRLGVTDVEDVGGCTRCSPELYFSHRRDAEAAGRHLAVIVAGGY
jgi:polyphenol oxidase